MSLDRIVRINARIAAGGAVQRNFGRTLFLNIPGSPGNNEEAFRNARTGVYPSFSSLAEDWPEGEPRNAGEIFFQQVPYPQPFLVGAYHPAGSLGYVFGDDPNPIASIQGLSDYSGVPTGSAVLGNVNYFVDSDGEVLYSIDKTNGAVTRLAPIPLHNASSLFVAANKLYVVNSQTNYLYEIVISDDYRLEPIGAITGGPVNIAGATSHVVGGVTTIYIVDGTQNIVYSLDLASQVATAIGTGVGAAVTGTPNSLTSNGVVLYLIANDELFSIDLANAATLGVATSLGEFMVGLEFLTEVGVAFYDGTTVFIIDNDENGLYSIDLTDASSTLIGSLYRLRKLTLSGTDSLFMNFTGANSLDAVASVIQSAFSTVFAGGFTVSVDTGRFIISNLSEIIGQGFQNSEVSRTLGLFGSNVESFNGSPAETIGEALDRVLRENQDWYFLTLSEDIIDTDDVLAAQSWAAANNRFFSLDSHEESALDTDSVDSYLNRLSRIASPRYEGFFSRFRDYKAVSFAGRFSSVNFAGNNSLITGKFRQLHGATPDNLDNAEIDVLNSIRVNHYTTVGGVNIVQEGVAGTGWIDVQYWLDWFSSRIQTGLFDLLISRERLPQTQIGVAAIADVINSICEQGVRNGGIAPGQLTEGLAGEIRNATGNIEFSGYLSNGYLVYVSPFATQTQADRESRLAPAINVWVKGSGAVHFLEVSAIFEQ